MFIRSTSETDIPAIQKLLNSGKPYVSPYNNYIYWVFMNFSHSGCLVAVDNQDIIGFLCAIPSTEHNSMFILQICTDIAKQDKHVATRLLDHLYHDCIQNNFSFIEFTICDDNDKSKALFHSFAKKHDSMLERTNLTFKSEITEHGYRIPLT